MLRLRLAEGLPLARLTAAGRAAAGSAADGGTARPDRGGTQGRRC